MHRYSEGLATERKLRRLPMHLPHRVSYPTEHIACFDGDGHRNDDARRKIPLHVLEDSFSPQMHTSSSP